MKIVLRNFETGLFLGRNERWTTDPAEALEFCSDFKATEHKCLHRLASTFAVVVDEPNDYRKESASNLLKRKTGWKRPERNESETVIPPFGEPCLVPSS